MLTVEKHLSSALAGSEPAQLTSLLLQAVPDQLFAWGADAAECFANYPGLQRSR